MQFPRIKTLRLKHGLTQRELAKKLGVGLSAYQTLERGPTRMKGSCIIKLADYYGVSLDYLTGRTDHA